MQARDFCFWMQSLFEVADVKQFDERQTALIKQHLELVFQHDPSITGVEHPPVVVKKTTTKRPDALRDRVHTDSRSILLC